MKKALNWTKTVLIGIVRFYFFVVILNVTMCVPLEWRSIYYGNLGSNYINVFLLHFEIFGRSSCGLPHSITGSLEVLLGPIFWIVAGFLILSKARLKIPGLSIILLSNFCLASIILGSITRDQHLVFRIVSTAGMAILIAASIIFAFFNSFTDKSSRVDRLPFFIQLFMIPSAIVSFFMIVYPPDPEWIKLKWWLWTYLPIVAIAAIATIFKSRTCEGHNLPLASGTRGSIDQRGFS
jgi:hypothetical protein